MPDAAEHAGDPPPWPSESILDPGKRAGPIRRAGQSVQQIAHHIAATIMDPRDLVGVIHRIQHSVLKDGGLHNA